MLLALLAGVAAGSEVSRTHAELAQLKQWIGALQQQLAAEHQQKQSVTYELQQLERQISTLHAQRSQQTVRLQEVEQGKADLAQRIRQLETEQRESQQALRALVRASYMLGQQSSVKLLLNQQTPADVARALAIFRYLVKAKQQQIKYSEKLQHEVAEKRTDLAQRQQQLNELLKLLQQNQAQLDAKRTQRERNLNAIQQRMKQNQQQVANFREREQELQRLLTQLRRQRPQPQPRPLASPSDGANPQLQSTRSHDTESALVEVNRKPTGRAVGSFQQYRGNLEAPIEGRITARFGQQKVESGLKWEGLMFEAEAGKQVIAIYSGQVVFADWFGGYGQLIVLDHGDGYMSLYGHNRLLRTQLGAVVDAGDWIGEAGSSGGLSRPGLYFEIRHHGEPRDPLQWCRI